MTDRALNIPPAAIKGIRKGGPSIRLLWICLICAAALAAMANKPIHLDDPPYLWTAQQILKHPLDPYRFEVNWYGFTEMMDQAAKNPPLVSYYQAAVAAVAGFDEIALHVAFIPFAVAGIFFTFLLARRLDASPSVAALGLLCSPAFFVSATTLMADVMMVALWLAAMWVWIRAVQENSPALLPLAGLLITTAVLTKYPALNLMPLMAVYALMSRRKWLAQFAALCVPLVLLLGYEWLSYKMYGQGHIFSAGKYATDFRADRSFGWETNLLTALSFTGGGTLLPALAILVTASRRTLMLALGGFLVLAILLAMRDSFGGFALRDASGLNLTFVLQFSAMCMLGVIILAASVIHCARVRSPASLLILLWIWGVFVFLAVINWTANARTMLPLVPAAAILAGQSFQSSSLGLGWSTRGVRKICYIGCIAISACVTLATGAMDYSFAAAFHDAAMILRERTRQFDGKIWFTGHWGFQWYAQAFASPLDPFRDKLQAGDLVVMMLKASNPERLPAGAVELVDRISVPVLPIGSTLSRPLGAGFYSSGFGPMPYAFGRPPAETFEVYRVTVSIAPATRPANEP